MMQKREVGMWKRLLALVIATMLSFTLSIPTLAANTSFSDVTANFWAYDAIQAAVSKGITNGYADGTFKPGNSVTNAHFAAYKAWSFYADEYTEGSKGTLVQGMSSCLMNILCNTAVFFIGEGCCVILLFGKVIQLLRFFILKTQKISI